MVKKGLIFGILTLVLVMMISSTVYAQNSYGRQKGRVTDADGNGIEGVQVIVNEEYKELTNANGEYNFLRLPAGNHVFTFVKQGYQPVRQGKQVAAIFNNRPLNIVMKPAEAPKPTPAQQVVMLVKEGQQLFQGGKVKDAVAKFDAALEINPADINASYFSGLAYLQMANYEKARERLMPLYKSLPDNPQLNIALADSHFYDKKFEQAQAYYEKLVALQKADTNTYLNLGICFDNMEMQSDAILAYKKALELDPNTNDAIWRLGIALAVTEKYEEAIEPLDKYIAIDANSEFKEEIEKALILSLKETAIKYYNEENFTEAKPLLERLVNEFADSEEAAEAEVLLEEISKK